MSVLDVRELTLRAGEAALRRIDLTVRAGEVVAVVGDAGASALVRAVAGVLGAASGVIRVEGEDVTGLAYGDVAARGVAFVPAGWVPFGGLTVRENVVVGAHGDTARADAVLRLARLRPEVAAAALPAAEVRVLAIAVALARRPRLVLVDGLVAETDPARYAAALGALRGARTEGVATLIAEPMPLEGRVPVPPEGWEPTAFDRVVVARGGLLRPWRDEQADPV